MANQETLDETDIKILRLLQQNSRLTVKELAAKIHLSQTPTFERQKHLERDGYRQRYSAVVDHQKLGNNVIVLCNIRLKQHTNELIQQFMDTVQTIDKITECYNTTGDYDFQIKVYARDMKDYQEFMLNTLGNINCIGSLHSIIVIGEIKNSHCTSSNKALTSHNNSTPINATKPLETSDFVSICYTFVTVCLYQPKLSYMMLSGSTPSESR